MCDGLPGAPLGAEAVGRFEDADPLDRLFVWSMRRWLEGKAGQNAVREHYNDEAGPTASTQAIASLEAYLVAIARHHSRILMRHQEHCSCMGADEAMLAEVVRRAGQGDLDQACAAAMQFVSPQGVFETVDAAGELARALLSLRALAPRPGLRSHQYAVQSRALH